MIWDYEDIPGLKICGEEYKLKYYADGAVLTITEPQRAIKQLMKIIHSFREFSEYNISVQKPKNNYKVLNARRS